MVLNALVSQPLESTPSMTGTHELCGRQPLPPVYCLLWSIAQFLKLQEVSQLIQLREGRETSIPLRPLALS